VLLVWSEFPIPDDVGSTSLRDREVQGARQKVSGLWQHNISRFNIHGTVHRSMTSCNNQQDAT